MNFTPVVDGKPQKTVHLCQDCALPLHASIEAVYRRVTPGEFALFQSDAKAAESFFNPSPEELVQQTLRALEEADNPEKLLAKTQEQVLRSRSSPIHYSRQVDSLAPARSALRPSAPPNSFRGFPSHSSVRSGHDAFRLPQSSFEKPHKFSDRPVRTAQRVGRHAQDVRDPAGHFPRPGFEHASAADPVVGTQPKPARKRLGAPELRGLLAITGLLRLVLRTQPRSLPATSDHPQLMPSLTAR